MRLTAAVTAAAAVLALGPSTAFAAPPQVEGVPVLAQTLIGNVTDQRVAVLSVHGVRRVEGGTVLYYSMGLRPQDRTGEGAFFGAYGNGNFTTLTQSGASSLPCAAAAIDLPGATAYSVLLPDGGQRCIATSTDFSAGADELAQAKVAYSVLAPIPASVKRVDVFIGSQLLQDVPVEEGLLEPVSDEASPVVGTGWPKVDTAAIATVQDPQSSVLPLRSRVTNLADKVSKAKSKTGSALEIDASVLFAVDKATLSPKASSVIAAAAKQITTAGTKGSIVVTGHTDNTASDSYNQTLSTRRAQAVAAALKTKLPATITIKAVGKGEKEPIADNATEQGRALNRRVTITLPQQGQG
jgi:outer membrane protein OmpA-like peptidoglycan-associated protein